MPVSVFSKLSSEKFLKISNCLFAEADSVAPSQFEELLIFGYPRQAIFALRGRQFSQNEGPESCEAITRLASFVDADTLTDLQLKLFVPGTHSIQASSSSQSSVSEIAAL